MASYSWESLLKNIVNRVKCVTVSKRAGEGLYEEVRSVSVGFVARAAAALILFVYKILCQKTLAVPG